MYKISCKYEVCRGWYSQNTQGCTNMRKKLAKIAIKKRNFIWNVDLRLRFDSNIFIYPWDLLGKIIKRVEHEVNTFRRNYWNHQFTKGVLLSEIFDFSNMDSSDVFIVNTKEYARVMGTKVVALCLRVLCVKFRANPSWVEGDRVKIMWDVLI